MKEGDILICKKDFHCTEYCDFKCERGDQVEIIKLHYDTYDRKTLVAYRIKNSEGGLTWIIIKRVKGIIPELYYAWDYFITIKERGDRIRKVAKEFVG